MSGASVGRRGGGWWRALRWALLAVCLALVLRFLADHREELAAIGDLSPAWIAAMLAVQLAYFAIQSERHRRVLERVSGRRLAGGAWFKIFILGRFLNTLVPQSGNVYRAVRLRADHDVSVSRYLGSMVSFGWMDTALILLLALGVTLATGDAEIGGFSAAALLAALLAAGVVAPFLLEAVWRWIGPLSGRLRPLHAKIAEMLEATAGAFRDPRYLAVFVGLGTAAFGLAALLFYLGFNGLGTPVRAQAVVVFVALFKLGNQVSLTPANLGVVELASGALAEALELGLARGILVSAAIRVVYYVTLFGLAVPMGGLGLLGRTRRAAPGPPAESPSETSAESDKAHGGDRLDGR